MEILMLSLGLICGGRSALTWAAVHRMHHNHSDTDQDPHSPIYKGIWNVLTSKWKVEYIPRKHINDLIKNPRLVFFHRHGNKLHVIYLVLLLMISFDALIYFGLAPFLFSWAGFGMLNYFAHKNGKPADVPLLNFIAPGEGWHKYHHDNPRAYKLNRYDPTGIFIEYIRTK